MPGTELAFDLPNLGGFMVNNSSVHLLLGEQVLRANQHVRLLCTHVPSSLAGAWEVHVFILT